MLPLQYYMIAVNYLPKCVSKFENFVYWIFISSAPKYPYPSLEEAYC